MTQGSHFENYGLGAKGLNYRVLIILRASYNNKGIQEVHAFSSILRQGLREFLGEYDL